MNKSSNIFVRFFRYIEPMWLDNKKQVSLRSVAAIALIVDFIINLHNSAAIVTKVLKLLFIDKPVDAALIAAMSGNLAQIAMMLITEASLIAALLALKAWQPIKPESYNYQQVSQQSTSSDQDKDAKLTID